MEILFINDELRAVQRRLGVGELTTLDDALGEGRAYFRHFIDHQDEPLSAMYAAQLPAWVRDAERAHQRGLARAKRPARDLLGDISSAPTIEEIPDERAMELHTAFTQGSEDRLGEIREVVDTINEYNGHVRDLASKASRALGDVRLAETMSDVSDAAGRAGDYLDRISNVVDVARGFATLAELDNRSPDEMQNAIGQVETALDAIDAGMTFLEAVPVISDLWDSYYLPAARRCLSLLRRIATQQARTWRFYFAARSRSWARGRPPHIPDDLVRFFPGGRSMFRFMWNVVCDQQVQPSSRVRSYFLDHEELFEAGTGSHIRTERHGFLWLKERIRTDLWAFSRVNRRALWAMLYGDLPYPAGVE